MKKFGVIALIFGLFLITGCGKGNKVVCSGAEKTNEQVTKIKVVGHLDGDAIVSVDTISTFDNKQAAEQYCNNLKNMNNDATNEEDKIDIECKDSSVTIKGKKENNKDARMPKETFIESMENQAYTCD